MNKNVFVVIEHLQEKVSDISYSMLAAGQELAQTTGGEVQAVLLGYQTQDLAKDFAADRVLYLDHPVFTDFTSDSYIKALSQLIRERQPRIVLMGHTTIGMDIAGGLSVRLNLPLVSQCQSFLFEDGTPKFVCQICGGRLMVEGDLPGPTSLITMLPGGYQPEDGKITKSPEITPVETPHLEEPKVKVVQYIQPETGEIDITKEPVLIAIGRGLQNQNDMSIVEALADALGGVVCASRPIVDLGWLPINRLVGKSGNTVKAKLYLALGISGAPEHIEGITGSETIIAVNTDPSAPIFDVADYGIDADLLDFVPMLQGALQKTKERIPG